MGAAFVGTLLGGAAVWLGLQARMDALEQQGELLRGEWEQAEADAERLEAEAAAAAEAARAAEAAQAEAQAQLAAPDPGDSQLVRAIAQTRNSVVTIDLLGRGPAGAGVIYDESGTLLTNYHVIEPIVRASLMLGDSGAAAGLVVRFVDGRERSATILAADPDEDIAVLAITREREQERFEAAPLGRSASLRLGEQVFSIGSPVGFEATVATGIISSLDRTGVLANRALPVLQLDAAINFGNSGGPLFNLAGEIVGITTARSSRGEGIGFAIPIDRIRLFLRALEQGMGGRSGVVGIELDPGREIADLLEPLGYHSGVAVTQVQPGGAAAIAGVRAGDVIVSLRGRRNDELDASLAGRMRFGELVGETVRGLLPGETLMIEVVRDGELQAFELVVEAASAEHQARIDTELLLGVRLEPDGSKPVIRSLVPGSPIAGMRNADAVLVGSRIVAVLGHEVASVEQLGEVIGALRGLATGGGRRTISIAIETADARELTITNFPLATGR